MELAVVMGMGTCADIVDYYGCLIREVGEGGFPCQPCYISILYSAQLHMYVCVHVYNIMLGVAKQQVCMSMLRTFLKYRDHYTIVAALQLLCTHTYTCILHACSHLYVGRCMDMYGAIRL